MTSSTPHVQPSLNQGQLAWLLDERENTSDTLLRLVPADSSPRTLFAVDVAVHWILLASKSRYFRTRIMSDTWDRAGQTDNDEGTPKRQRTEAQSQGTERLPAKYVEESYEGTEELERMKSLVELMYTDVVPSNLTCLQVARMCCLADQWMAEECMQQCSKRVKESLLGTPSVPPAEVIELLTILKPIKEQIGETYSVCEESGLTLFRQKEFAVKPCLLLHYFGDVHALLSSSKLLSEFTQLPFEAVRVWAGSYELVVDSENSVAVALDVWVRVQQEKEPSGCTEEQGRQLARLIRVYCLSTAYVLHFLPNLHWFASPMDLKSISLRVLTKTFSSVGFPRKCLSEAEVIKAGTLEWSIPGDKLQAALTTPRGVSMLCGINYLAGVGLRLRLDISSPSADGSRSISLLVALSDFKHGQLLVAPKAEPVQLAGKLTRQATGSDGEVAVVLVSQFGPTIATDAVGVLEMLSIKSSTDWEPFLVDGALKIGGEITLWKGH